MATSNQSNQGNSDGSQKRGVSERGFASMDPQRQREIASAGGRASHQSGNAHEFTSAEAREAGKKSHGGGQSSRKSNSTGSSSSASSTRGGNSDQHAEVGGQTRKNS